MRVRHICLFLAALLLSLVTANDALAAKRVALVIGNSAYQNVAQLPNPANDAAAVADMFKKAGFDAVDSRNNLGSVDMRRVLRDFYDQAAGADIAVVYYAGHGIEVGGINYMIPVDAVLNRDRDVDDEAVSLDRILETIEQAKQLRLIILDACRDSPFAKTMQRTAALRSISRGLITVQPTSPNTLIAYAAKGGSTADDGNRNHSPFTAALLAHLGTPGLDIRQAFGMVRDDVMKATNNQQEPYLYGSLGGAQVALVNGAPATAVAAPPPATPPGDPNSQMRLDYEFAERVGTKAAWTYFLEHYPDGFYANLAKAQLDKLNAETPAASRTSSSAQPNTQTAALPSGTPQSKIDSIDLARSVKSELKRLGCYFGNIDSDWNAASRKSLDQFNKYAPASLDTKNPSSNALDALTAKTSRVCPLSCDHGFRADGDTCAKIVCRDGYRVGDDKSCEKIPPKTATRDSGQTNSRRQQQPQQARQPAPAPTRQSSSGSSGGGAQIICDMHGCIPKPKGCVVVGTATGEACQ